MIETKCDVRETAKDFRYWSSLPGLSHLTSTNIATADIVVVPWEQFGGHHEPLFPVGTVELFQFLKTSAPSNLEVGLAGEDEAYQELSLHSDIIRLATIAVRDGAFGVILNLLATWIARRIWPDKPTNSTPEVHASVIVTRTSGNDAKSIEIQYRGPAATFETTVRKAFEDNASGQSGQA